MVGPCAGNGLKGSNSSIPFGSAVKKDVPSCIEELRMARNGKVLVVSRGGTLQNSFRLRTECVFPSMFVANHLDSDLLDTSQHRGLMSMPWIIWVEPLCLWQSITNALSR